MTLVSIVTQALVALGMSTDAQTTEAWKDKLAMFANDGMRDLAQYIHIRKEEDVTAVGGRIRLSDLSATCVKVLTVKQDGSDMAFTFDPSSYYIHVAQDGAMTISYEYIPKDMVNDTDVPDLPEALHPLLIPYCCFSEHMTRDPNTQRRANMFYDKYDDGRRKFKRNMGESDTYTFINTVSGW